MLETIGQFRLQYSDQAQGRLGSLVAMPSLPSRVIHSQGQDVKIVSIKDRVQSGMCDEGWAITHMVVFSIRDGLWSLANRFERGDP